MMTAHRLRKAYLDGDVEVAILSLHASLERAGQAYFDVLIRSLKGKRTGPIIPEMVFGEASDDVKNNRCRRVDDHGAA